MGRSNTPGLGLVALLPLLLVGLACGPGPDTVPVPEPFAGVELSFVAPVDGVDQIWLGSTGGAAPAPWSEGARAKALPTWTPDGRRLVYVEHLDEGSCFRDDILMVDEGDGEEPRQVAVLTDVRALAPDADNRGVFVVTDQCSDAGLFISLGRLRWIDLEDGAGQSVMGFSAIPSVRASPLPGGFAVSAGAYDNSTVEEDEWVYEEPDLYVGTLAVPAAPDPDPDPGVIWEKLADSPASDHGISWHPSGERLAFESGRDGPSAVFVVSVFGGEPQRITPPQVLEFAPQWSPDGATLMVQRSDGTALRTMIDGGGGSVDFLPGIFGRSWSPDQRWLLLDGDEDVRVFNLASGESLELGPGRAPSWRPSF